MIVYGFLVATCHQAFALVFFSRMHLTLLQYRLQQLTGPIEPVVTLGDTAADASLVLAWTINTPVHVPVSVCAGTWGNGDPTPTFVGSPVVVYVQQQDDMRTVKERAVQVRACCVSPLYRLSAPPLSVRTPLFVCSAFFSAMSATARSLPGGA